MPKKIVYVEPGYLLEIRVCDPVFEEGANKGAWDQSMNPSSMLLEVDGFDSLSVVGVSTSVSRGFGVGNKIPLEAVNR